MTYDLNWLIKSYSSFFAKYGLVVQDMVNNYQEWHVKSKNNCVKDYLWHFFHLLLTESVKQSKDERQFYSNNLDIYMNMWEFRVKIENSKANDILRSIEECRIRLGLIDLPFNFKVQVISGHCCSYCNTLNGRLFSPQDALKNMYVGSEKCTREWGCNCRTINVAVRE